MSNAENTAIIVTGCGWMMSAPAHRLQGRRPASVLRHALLSQLGLVPLDALLACLQLIRGHGRQSVPASAGGVATRVGL